MIKNTRVFSGLSIFFWSTLTAELIILELSTVNIITMLVPLIVSTVGTITMLILFIVSYHKSKPKVIQLKNEYLESLKPKTPLRFCASDDELLKAYKASANEIMKQPLKEESQKLESQLNQTNPSKENSSEEEIESFEICF